LAETLPNSDCHVHLHANGYAHSHGNTHGNGYTHSHGNTHSYTNG